MPTRHSWMLAALWAITIFALSSIPGRSFPAMQIFNYDKVIHACLCRAGRAVPLGPSQDLVSWRGLAYRHGDITSARLWVHRRAAPTLRSPAVRPISTTRSPMGLAVSSALPWRRSPPSREVVGLPRVTPETVNPRAA